MVFSEWAKAAKGKTRVGDGTGWDVVTAARRKAMDEPGNG